MVPNTQVNIFGVNTHTLDHLIVLIFILVLGPHRRRAQQDELVHLCTADVPAVYVAVPPKFIAI